MGRGAAPRAPRWRVEGKDVLETGCGRGVGTEIILERFGARRVKAFDLDPDMVERARRRLARFPRDRVEVSVGDATAIDAPDASIDAVFDFGIVHHIPDWPRAVREVRRFLRLGGRFFFEEVSRSALERWPCRTFLVHPKENRFTREDFVAELEQTGLRVADRCVERFFGDFFLGVARVDGGVATGPPRSARRMSASRAFPVSPSRRITSTSRARGCTTSTRGRAAAR